MSGPFPVHSGAGSPLPPSLPVSETGGAGDVPFADLVSGLLQETSEHQAAIGDSVRQLVTGQSDSIHDVVLAASRADLAFRLVMEIRNRLIASYEEIMRMQI